MHHRFPERLAVALRCVLVMSALSACTDIGDSTAVLSTAAPVGAGGLDASVVNGRGSGPDATTADEATGDASPEAAAALGPSDDSTAPGTVPDAPVSALEASADAGSGPDGASEAATGQKDAAANGRDASASGGDALTGDAIALDATLADGAGDAHTTGDAADAAPGYVVDAAPENPDAPGAPTTDGILMGVSDDCYMCASTNACDDMGMTGNTCEDFGDSVVPATAAVGAGQGEYRLCIETLECLIANRKTCINSGNPQNCLCGDAGDQCTKTFNPGVAQNGPCWPYEVPGLETNTAASYDEIFTEAMRPAGRANNLIVCLNSNGCDACFK